jgi:hypothetical protein
MKEGVTMNKGTDEGDSQKVAIVTGSKLFVI